MIKIAELRKAQKKMEEIRKISLDLIIAAKNITDLCSQFNIDELSFEEKVQFGYENLNYITMTHEQEEIMRELTQELTILLSYQDYVINGFLLRSIKKWQLKYNRPIIVIAKMNKFQQFEVGKEILENFIELLERSFYIRDKNDKKLFFRELLRKLLELLEELLSVSQFLKNPENQEYILEFEIDNWLKGNHPLI